MTFKEKFIGDKKFYRLLLVLLIPMVVQQGITNFVSLLDNLMVGELGTIHMSAVSIVNQFLFVCNLAIFGGLAGASIYGTQFFGYGDWHGMRDTFRFKLLFSAVIVAAAIALFLTFDEELVLLFLKNENNTAEDIAMTLAEAKRYLKIAVIGLIPFGIVQVYSSTLREMGETVIPMVGGVIAIVVNLVFNYLLIFGHFGFPRLGVAGAAIATLLSRVVELVFVIVFTHVKHNKYKFIEGVYRGMKIPAALAKKIMITGAPLLLNEIMWALGQTFINSNYAQRGITVVAATNISSTAWNLFSVIMLSMGSAVGIIVGQKLGTGDKEAAFDTDRKLLFFTFVSQIGIAAIVVAVAPLIPMLYNVEAEVRALATSCLTIAGISLPLHALVFGIYFTIRSGGKTFLTFLFDSVFTWVVPCVISFILCRYTSVGIITIFFIVQFVEGVKLIFGIPIIKSGSWANCVIKDITSNEV
ncbi:MAG: MATE family efflux transporter [Ruminococcaceae bacterium]|nr:MATE family efflux transporter [Oscillospiraceae bacterium]